MAVTVCALFQSAVVKVRLAGLTVPSVVSLLDSAIVTVAGGCVFRTTVKLAVPPLSVVTSPTAD